MRNIPLLEDADLGMKDNGEDSPEGIEKAYNFTRLWGSVLAFVLIILWPCLALPATVFSKGYFTYASLSTTLLHSVLGRPFHCTSPPPFLAPTQSRLSMLPPLSTPV